mmetsp:Transcript_14263/g.43189  ORF Transcript_14263/g.43189 Transcript_14263/m.43189 type:complete len:96 (-) Transcript_14263:57-344(-)
MSCSACSLVKNFPSSSSSSSTASEHGAVADDAASSSFRLGEHSVLASSFFLPATTRTFPGVIIRRDSRYRSTGRQQRARSGEFPPSGRSAVVLRR